MPQLARFASIGLARLQARRLWAVAGLVGAHRFYFGKKKSGALYLFTFGGLGIGWVYDAFQLKQWYAILPPPIDSRAYAWHVAHSVWALISVMQYRVSCFPWGGGIRLYIGHRRAGMSRAHVVHRCCRNTARR